LSGGIAGQYARLTGLALSGQMSQVGKVLFRPQDLLLDSVLGGAFAGIGYGLGRLATGGSTSGDLASAGMGCSFSEDTPVATIDGEKPIGEIQVGDEVLAYDEQSQAAAYYPVTAKFAHLDTDLVTLTIEGEEIETTSKHPFFTEGFGWVPAGDLWLGVKIRKSDGSSGVVGKIELEHSSQLMFNLTVDEAHTFYVGSQEWLVHNSCVNRSILRKNIGLSNPNQSAHHLIPWEFRNHPIVRFAEQAGWDMNHSYNGIGLSNEFHGEIPGHPEYNSYVQIKLDNFYDRSIKSGWSAEQAYDALMYLTDILRARINY
jgi:hypothetical protein